MTFQSWEKANLAASNASVTEPIWFTFNNKQLQADVLMAFLTRSGLVTVKSSPTICVFPF